MWSGPLTMTSVIVSSARSGSSGPRPVTSAMTSCTRRRRSSRVSARPLVVMNLSTMPSTCVRSSGPSPAANRACEAPTTSTWSLARASRSISSRAASWAGAPTGMVTTAVAVGSWREVPACWARSMREERDMVSIRLPGASAPALPLPAIVRGAGRSGKSPREYCRFPDVSRSRPPRIVDAATTSGYALRMVVAALTGCMGQWCACRRRASAGVTCAAAHPGRRTG